jgi:hypothetical protein
LPLTVLSIMVSPPLRLLIPAPPQPPALLQVSVIVFPLTVELINLITPAIDRPPPPKTPVLLLTVLLVSDVLATGPTPSPPPRCALLPVIVLLVIVS